MEAIGILIIVMLIILLIGILRYKAREKPHMQNINNQHRTIRPNPSNINKGSSSNRNHEKAYRGSAPRNNYDIKYVLKHIKPVQVLMLIIILVIGVPIVSSALNRSMERMVQPFRKINKRLNTINNENAMSKLPMNKLHEVKPITNTYNNEDPIITFNKARSKTNVINNPIDSSIFSKEQAIGLLDKGQGSYISANNNKKLYIEKSASMTSKHPDNTYTLSIINTDPNTGMARPATNVHITSAYMCKTAGVLIKGVAENPSSSQKAPIQMLIIFNKNNKDIEVSNNQNLQARQNSNVQNEPNGLQRASSQLENIHLKNQINN